MDALQKLNEHLKSIEMLLCVILLLQSATASDTCSSVIHVDSENGVNQSTCWAQGQAQPCDSLQLALQGDQLATSALVLHQPEDYRTMSDNSCVCDKLEATLKNNLPTQFSLNCPTWFKRNFVSDKCECGHKIVDVIHCHEDNDYAYASILNCYCMTLQNNTLSRHGVSESVTSSDKLLVGACHYNCFHNTSYTAKYTPYHPLPQDPQDLNNATCARYHRRGRLCSECTDRYHQPVYSYELSCVKCSISKANILLYILIAFGPSTIFLFVMLTCKLNGAAPPLHGHIQLMQLTTSPIMLRVLLGAMRTSTKYKNCIPAVKAFATICGIWNLDFFRTVIPPMCLNINTLSAISLDYLVAVYPLALTVIIYALIELHAHNVRLVVWLWRPFHKYVFLFRRQWNIKSSIADTFATFMLLSYVKFSSVTFKLLFPVVVYDIDDHREVYLYYDASIKYFGSKHFPYALLAVAVCILFLIIPVIFLVIYPYASNYKSLHFLQHKSRFVADIAKAFHSCYKNGSDGTGNYQCFAAVYFILRALIFVTDGATHSGMFWGIGAIQFISVAILFIIIQPYKSPIYNILEFTHLLFLAMFTVAALGPSATNLHESHFVVVAMTIAVSISCLPILYGTCLSFIG